MDKTMYAYRNRPKELGGLQLVKIFIPDPKANEVLIKVLAVGLNYRDLRMIEGTYTFNFKYDTIIGADCCGEVVKTGDNVEKDFLGKTVIVNPNVNWGDDYDVPSTEFSILGTPHDGVFAEYITVAIDRIALKPAHLSNTEAAVVPLAGITAYRTVFTKGGITKKSNVLITGVSGGVAHFALLLCVAIGANVWVTSSDDRKINVAVQLGAKGGANYKQHGLTNHFSNLQVKFDVIIDCAGGNQIAELLSLLKPFGKLILYGAMNGKSDSFDLFTLYYNQLQVIGTLMGNDTEFERMLLFINENKVKPVVDCVMPFSKINDAFDRLKTKSHFGKIVLEL